MQDGSVDRSLLPPARQGLYDPANERDACGLGFIAHIKGQKTHAIVTQGSSILKNLTHRGATGADPLQGDGAGILIQLPDAFLRTRVRPAGPHAARGRPVRRGHGVPAEGTRLADGLRAGDRARGRERGPDPARLARRTHRQPRPLAAHEGGRAGDPAGVHRARVDRDGPGRARAQALHHPQEVGPRDPGAEAPPRQGILRAVDVVAHARLQGHAARAPGRRVLPRPEGREHGHRRSRWCTSASRPTRSRRGTSRTRSASSATTARSTRCAATSTGSARASRASPAVCWATTSTRSGR